MKILEEDGVATSSGDVAIQPEVIGRQHRGLPCFDIESETEWNSFNRGIKTFRRWKKHSKSEEIRQWANKFPKKDFYIHCNGKFTKINRKGYN